jgi:hypothetical protein
LILLLANVFALSAQDNVLEPFDYDSRYQSFARFRVEAESYTDLESIGVRGRIGGYYDSADKLAGYMALGIRIAQGSFFEFNLFPFWLNYSFKDRNYNTPVTLEMIIWDYRHPQDDLGFRLSIDLDFYRDTFVPSLNVAFQPWKKYYR